MIECKRCKHTWNPRTKNGKPKECPNCKSYSYDTDRKFTIDSIKTDEVKT